MSSPVLPARSKMLLVLSLLSMGAGVAAVSAGQRGPAEAGRRAGAGEAAAVSGTGAPVAATVELPMPPPRAAAAAPPHRLRLSRRQLPTP